MKRCNLIKRFFIGLLLIVVASISAYAQEGLYVKSIFQRFGHAKGCKMVTMQNTQLKGYRLKIYKSLVYKNHATEIAHYLRERNLLSVFRKFAHFSLSCAAALSAV